MTFEVQHRQGVFHCDTCPDHIEVDETEFVPALNAAKAKGWRSYRGPDNEWAHSCPSCTEDFGKRKR